MEIVTVAMEAAAADTEDTEELQMIFQRIVGLLGSVNHAILSHVGLKINCIVVCTHYTLLHPFILF